MWFYKAQASNYVYETLIDVQVTNLEQEMSGDKIMLLTQNKQI